MEHYPYDPKTGKKLMRSGFSVNALQPMTQREVDVQCDLVTAFLDAGGGEITEDDEINWRENERPRRTMKITESYLVSEHTTDKGSIIEKTERTAVNTGNCATYADTDVDMALQEAMRLADGLHGKTVSITEQKLAQFGLSTSGLEQAVMVTVDGKPVAIVGTWKILQNSNPNQP